MSTLIQLLRSVAAEQPELRLYTLLNEDVTAGPHLTAAELDKRARAIAALLQKTNASGARALLLYPQGLDFIAAFFGCLYAGVIAIPAPLPDEARIQRMLGRLHAIVNDGAPLFGLTTSKTIELLEKSFSTMTDLPRMQWLATDEVDPALAEHWREPAIRSDSLAYLQYTSGSTSQPKGVMVSHGNVLHNSIGIREAWGYDRQSASIVWVPQFHDDGLVHGVLQPLATGYQSFIMSPFAFVKRPVNWLRAVSLHRATHTGGPNFAYALCTKKVTPQDSAGLDLSSWRMAYNAAEPVRLETMAKFFEKFAPQGFRWEAFYPAYGLAEATLLVTTRKATGLPEFLNVEVESLEQLGRVRDGGLEGSRSRTMVGCGRVTHEMRVVIVDPETAKACDDNEVGEIWISSPSVAQGYWNRPEETERTFGAHLKDTEEGPFLLTGDLGFMRDGELFITGRLKDLIIVDGSNHYPQDIEWTAEQSDGAMRRGASAAFALEENGAERLVIVAEVDSAVEPQEYDRISANVWQAVAEQNQLEIYILALLKPGSIPKTSSGKIQRHACRTSFQQGTLNIVAQWKQRSSNLAAQSIPEDLQTKSGESSKSQSAISEWLLEHLSAHLNVKPEELNVHEPFARYGLVSSAAVSMLGDLETWLGRRLSPTLVWAYPNIDALAKYLSEGGGEREVETGSAEQQTSEPIAIVGIGCRFPGADGPEAFWSLLRDGVDAITEVPAERWNLSDFYDESPNVPGKMNTRWGGFVKDVAGFDTEFFGISPREAARIDPQQRLLLEVTWEALEDCGQIPRLLAGTKCGVFVGISTNDYSQFQLSDPALVDAYLGTGNAFSISANRLSYFLDLHGPSVAVDTACSSSLVAVHLACQSLRNGEATLALAGGVNLILSPAATISFTKAGAMSPDGRCKSFDARANGYVRSEGAGMVVLKPLSRALADGDSIYAVIRGTAVNNDGRTNGLMAPSPQAQEAVLRAAYQRSGIAPSQVQYVEAHGSGTFLGDPIEAGALGAVLSEGRSADQPCAIGSVKSNIGHLEAAAGIAGLIKVALALRHGEVPASLHFDQPNPHIPFADLKLRVPQKLAPWPADNGHAYAGVSSFGFGGTNAHVVLEHAPVTNLTKEDTIAESAERAYLFPISAHSPEALLSLVRSYISFAGTATLADLCYSATFSRTHHEHRLSLVAQTREELVEQLTAFLHSEKRAGMYTGRSWAKVRKLVFVFPGQGSQWRGMAQQLWKQEPVFRASIERTARVLSRHVKWSLVETLNSDDPNDPRFDQIDVIQPMLFALQVALARLWASWGVKPDAVVGQSMGEVAAAHVAGALSLEDAVRIISERSLLLREKRGLGQMMSVDLSLEAAQRLLVGYEDRVSVAVSSSPTATILSGESNTLKELMERLQQDDIFCAMVKVDVASHSSQMDSLREPLLQVLVNVRPNVPATPLYSTVLGGPVNEASLDAVYWWRNLREPVLFSTAIQNLLSDGHDLFLEISAHPVVSAGIQQTLQTVGQKGDVLPSLRREEPERQVLLGTLGALYTNGFDIDWHRLYESKRPFIKLPSYPWQRERCWLDLELNASPSTRFLSSRPGTNGHPLLPTKPVIDGPAGKHSWEIDFAQSSYLREHRVNGLAILPATAYLEMALAAAGQLFGPVELTHVEFKEALPIAGDVSPRVRLVLTAPVNDVSTFRFHGQSAATNTPTLHASGQIKLHDGPAAPEQISVNTVKERCTEEIAGSDFYLELENRGHEYGPSFQAVKRIWRRAGEALGQLEPTAEVESGSTRYTIHPAILDACLQLCAATFENSTDAAVYLPVAIRQVQFTGNPKTPAWGHAILRADRQNDDYEADVLMLDQEGRVIVAVLGLRLRRSVRGAALLSTSRRTDWFYQIEWQLKPRASQLPTSSSPKGAWLIFTDGGAVGEALSLQLNLEGKTCVLVTRGPSFAAVSADHYRIDPASPDDFRRLLDEFKNTHATCRGIVHLWGLDVASVSATTAETLDQAQLWGCQTVLSLVQAMAETRLPNARLWLVTRGVQQCDPEDTDISVAPATLWGFGRSIAQEFPELRCTNVDLGHDDAAGEARSLFQELVNSDDETQVALRGEKRYCARLARMSEAVAPSPRQRTKRPFIEAEDKSFRVELTEPGTLENLELHAVPRVNPAAGEVEIEVNAAGLNFVDVLKALGMAPGFGDGPQSLGGECSGTITAVGQGVTDHQVGDEVIAIASGCFGKYVIGNASLVHRKPSHLTFAEAATIPVAFVTAYYALHKLGQLREGERVLIHAASGGVGLAAVQLAQLAGAEIYATAGSEEKREFLRSLGIQHVLDSRTLSFAREVLDLTGGKGVDLVLNSLSGEAISQSISILSPYGRFLEIGKRDIYQNNSLQLEPFRKNLSFFAIDVERMYRERPQFVGDLMRELLDRFEEHALKPLPHRTFPINETENGFRLMAQARHTGKIVFSVNDQEVTIATTPERFRNECTYLIAGGLGALGLALASWMVQRGARHLMLLGRHEPSASARDIIRELEQSGAQIETHQTDITQSAQVAEVMAGIRESMPPLKGVVHAAGILDDHILLQMSPASLAAVLAPKLHGAWNLHAATLDTQLDFFVLFSSAASIFGPAGQANYAAANAFLDALAHHRRALHLPALSINWGPWAEIGLASSDGRGGSLERQGFGFIKPQQGLAALDVALNLETVAQTVIMPVDWQRFREHGRPTSFVEQLLAEETSTSLQPPTASTLTGLSLSSIAAEERPRVLQDYLRTQVARVLGIPAARIDHTTPLNRMGLDSVMAVELKYRLEGLGVVIPVVKFLKGASIESLSQLAIAELAGHDTAPAPKVFSAVAASGHSEKAQQVLSTSPHSPQLDAAIEQLSENDLDSLLDKLIAEQAGL